MENENVKLMLGDNIEKLRELPDNFVDSIVTDPPYGLSFMNKKWDYDVPSVNFWKEVLRVLKPGGHVLSFGGTRTYHRMVVNMEDAGFEIRDQIMWVYGSGFPKSHNIGKAVDKLEGNQREVIDKIFPDGSKPRETQQLKIYNENEKYIGNPKYTKGTSPYEGWGTALKPANEPICVARKPLSEKTIAENVLRWGTGGINVDGCRIGYEENDKTKNIVNYNYNLKDKQSGVMYHNYDGETKPSTGHKEKMMVFNNEGRFPANFIIECICDEVIPGDIHTNPNCPCRLLDEQSGISESKKRKNPSTRKDTSVLFNAIGITNTGEGEYNDKGGASRFFYVPKVSKKERNLGLDGFEEKESVLPGLNTFDESGNRLRADGSIIPPLISKNNHPTVKPINLLTYLVRLITPPNGVVMDCYMGSGSVGIAAQLEGFQFIGMEMDKDYFNIAETRINNWEQYKDLIK
jgi:DNA modification methylase